jgi:hypothetical protein
LDCANGIVDLDVASVLARGRCVGLAFRVHDGRLGGRRGKRGVELAAVKLLLLLVVDKKKNARRSLLLMGNAMRLCEKVRR